MRYIKVNTQAELDEALKLNEEKEIQIVGSGVFSVSGSSQVRAYGSSQVTAYGSSQVRAYGSSQVRAYDSSQVTASKFVAITRHGTDTKVYGGIQRRLPEITTVKQWCEFYGVEIKGGIAILYKTVRDDYKSAHGMEYKPGTTPVALDWDGGKAECGGGFHFSPWPYMALRFDQMGKKFIACPLLMKEIVIHKNAMYPEKVKAPRVYQPCFEVDIDGEPIKGEPHAENK